MLDIPAILLTFAALFGVLNYRLFRLPLTIGLVVIALVSSIAMMGLDAVMPSLALGDRVRGLLEQIDFTTALMKGMLSFLLFAGALHVDLTAFMSRKWTVSLLASVGVVMSTALNGTGMYFLAQLFGFDLPFALALVFGALISPTDPVAVMAVLKRLRVPKALEATIAGESLFNDGVAVVIYSILVTIAFAASGGDGHAAEITVLGIAELFAIEALGGAALGFAAGTFAFWLMRGVDDTVLEIIITLALVTGAYAVALHFHLSGPIAMVIAGILIGNFGFDHAVVDKERVQHFWDLVDEILNAVLFLLIGFEVVVLDLTTPMLALTLVVIVMVTVVRWLAVGFPLTFMGRLGERPLPGMLPILTWAGLRGGISVALVLALPDSPQQPMMLTVCYGVVLFSIVIQGLTIERVIRRYV